VVNKSKARGTMAESAVAEYLAAHGWPYCERRTLGGSMDKGDIAGTPGICWEVKYTSGAMHFGMWLRELHQETANAKAEHGILIIKPPRMGTTRVGRWLAVMRAAEHDRLIEQYAAKVPLNGHYINLPEPVSHRPSILLTLMATRSEPFFARTTVPVGLGDHPELYYRTMYLEQMVYLLRVAGFGDPL
jgi:hypothetical protein